MGAADSSVIHARSVCGRDGGEPFAARRDWDNQFGGGRCRWRLRAAASVGVIGFFVTLPRAAGESETLTGS